MIEQLQSDMYISPQDLQHALVWNLNCWQGGDNITHGEGDISVQWSGDNPEGPQMHSGFIHDAGPI